MPRIRNYFLGISGKSYSVMTMMSVVFPVTSVMTYNTLSDTWFAMAMS